MKENTQRIVAQLPVSVATFLLNEKRRAILEIEHRQDTEVLLLPNEHLHTPDYRIERVRLQDATKPDELQSSYELTAPPEPSTKPLYAKLDTKLGQPDRREEPAVKHVAPSAPAPQRESSRSPSPAAPRKEPERMEPESLLKRIWTGLFMPRAPDSETSALPLRDHPDAPSDLDQPSPIRQQPHSADRDPQPQRQRSNGPNRGERPNQGRHPQSREERPRGPIRPRVDQALSDTDQAEQDTRQREDRDESLKAADGDEQTRGTRPGETRSRRGGSRGRRGSAGDARGSTPRPEDKDIRQGNHRNADNGHQPRRAFEQSEPVQPFDVVHDQRSPNPPPLPKDEISPAAADDGAPRAEQLAPRAAAESRGSDPALETSTASPPATQDDSGQRWWESSADQKDEEAWPDSAPESTQAKGDPGEGIETPDLESGEREPGEEASESTSDSPPRPRSSRRRRGGRNRRRTPANPEVAASLEGADSSETAAGSESENTSRTPDREPEQASERMPEPAHDPHASSPEPISAAETFVAAEPPSAREPSQEQPTPSAQPEPVETKPTPQALLPAPEPASDPVSAPTPAHLLDPITTAPLTHEVDETPRQPETRPGAEAEPAPRSVSVSREEEPERTIDGS